MKLLVTTIVFSVLFNIDAAYNIYSNPAKGNELEKSVPSAQRVGNNFRSSDWRMNEIEHQLPDDDGNNGVRFVYERTTPRFANKFTTQSSSHQNQADFYNDDEINEYLRESKTDAMIWSCQNYVQAMWRGRPIPFVDLMCDVIGEVKSLEVSFKGRKLDFMKSGSRYSLSASPMRTGDGRFSNNWLRYRIRIHNAARLDAGKYEIQLLSAQNRVEKQTVIVDIRRGKAPARYN